MSCIGQRSASKFGMRKTTALKKPSSQGDNPKAHSTFNVQMVHGVLQVTVTIAVHCILYQGLSQGIHS